MALTELVDSREIGAGSIIRHYSLTGTADDATAYASVLSGTPTTYLGGVRDPHGITVRPVVVDSVAGSGLWDVSVRYIAAERVNPNPPEIGTLRIRGSTIGQTVHITSSKGTVAAYGIPGGLVPTVNDAKNLIGATVDSVDGTDIEVGELAFEVAYVYDPSSLPTLSTLVALSSPNHVNNASKTFTDTVTGLSMTFAAGELRYRGFTFGDSRADGGVEFVHAFIAYPNATGLVIGDITGIAKKGHEYLWTYNVRTAVTGPEALMLNPIAAYVEKVYDEGDFSVLPG